MLQSQLPQFIRKEFPKDEEALNARLLIRAGFVEKVMAGVYSYLPLGLRVLSNIEQIIRRRMEELGAYEILMPSLHPKESWSRTGRWDEFDALFKIISRDKKEYALGPTHEEIVVPLAQKSIASYKDLPFALFQIQTKFRDEARPKSGLLRGREFLMKDLYSFHANHDDLDVFYKKVEKAYEKIFKDLGLGKITHRTFASGGTFSKYSHEYQTVLENGEDTIFLCASCGTGVNKEIVSSSPTCPECGSVDLKETTASEVGNIFKLNTKYSDPFSLVYADEEGNTHPVIMGCYGIGVSRLMGVIAEAFHDQRGLLWPESVAPFSMHLLSLPGKTATQTKSVQSKALRVYSKLKDRGIEVLFDDRTGVTAGEKFAESDLLGIPARLVISQKTGDKIEYKKRNSASSRVVDFSTLAGYGKR